MSDNEFDVVVVGSGAAGLSAAAVALSEGCRVVVLEKASQTGGTSKKAGMYWIPNNRFMREQKLEDPKEWALKLMARLAYPVMYDPDDPHLGLPELEYSLIESYYDHGALAIDQLDRIGALRSMSVNLPEYSGHLPENRAPMGGRHLLPAGLLSEAMEGKSGLGGNGLVEQLEAFVVRKGGKVLTEHEVTSVTRNRQGKVTGVLAKTPSGKIEFHARRGVVFGSGGFTHNLDLVQQYLRGPIFGGCAVPTNTGDFVLIGQELGAALGNMTNAWWAEDIFEDVLVNRATESCVFLPQGDAMVIVNRYGHRVVNEKAFYNERGQAHFYWDPGQREYPNLLLFMIYDESVANYPEDPTDTSLSPARLAPPSPGERQEIVISGATLEELAQNLDSRLAQLAHRTGSLRLASGFVDTLRATIERFNGYAIDGHDPEFGRGDELLQRLWSQPHRSNSTSSDNQTMFPFAAHGPYHCIILSAGTLDTKGGPRVNARAQVLDVRGRVIPGLYGAGNCIASPTGQAYFSAGATLGVALIFGFLAGKGVAREPLESAAGTVNAVRR